MTAKIVVVGSFNADLTSYMEQMPRPGETVIGQRFITGPGGKGSNQAVAAARLGAEVTFVGRVGRDVFADYAFDIWNRETIRTNYVMRDEVNATGVASIFVDQAGENVIVVTPGANGAISRADIDAAAEAIARADILLTQLEIDPAITTYALQTARSQGVRAILNPAPASVVSAQMLALADVITPNETELTLIAGAADSSPEAIARTLITRPDQTIIVTLGAEGATAVRTNEHFRLPAFRIKVVDTTGAGDAFNGGLAVALAEGCNLRDSLRFASATAAYALVEQVRRSVCRTDRRLMRC